MSEPKAGDKPEKKQDAPGKDGLWRAMGVEWTQAEFDAFLADKPGHQIKLVEEVRDGVKGHRLTAEPIVKA